MADATDFQPADDVHNNERVSEARVGAVRRQMNRAQDMSATNAACTPLTSQRKRLAADKLSKRMAAVAPIMAPPVAVPFPGGTVTAADDGRMTVAIDPHAGARTLTGSSHRPFAKSLLDGVLAALPTRSPADAANRIAAAAAALAAFKPADEVEAMLAGQAVAMHHGAMECFRRAMLRAQHPDIASKLRKDGANLARGMTDMLEALDRKRGKGPQVVRVERVVVHEGGQAIVGSVQPAVQAKVGEGRG